MDKRTWQEYHGFTDEDMEAISLTVKQFKGTITEINGRKLDYEIINYNK